MKPRSQSYIIYVLFFITIIVLIVFNMNKSKSADNVLTINQLANEISQGNIARVVEEENKLTVYYRDGILNFQIIGGWM